MQTLETTVNRAARVSRTRRVAVPPSDLQAEPVEEGDSLPRLSCVVNAPNRAFCRESGLPQLYSALVCTRHVRAKAVCASCARSQCASLVAAHVVVSLATAHVLQNAASQVLVPIATLPGRTQIFNECHLPGPDVAGGGVRSTFLGLKFLSMKLHMASQMKKQLAKLLIGTLAITSIALLQGCGNVPGFSFASPMEDNQTLPPDFQYLSVDGAPEGVITSISPALIRALSQSQSQVPSAEVFSLVGKPQIYTIGPGDVVGILVYDHPELLPNAGAVISQQVDPTGVSVAPGFIVSATGEISFPYIGKVRLQGLTEIESADLITRRIADYIRDPQVTVRIQAFRSRRAYVEGEVRTPGLQIFTDVPMTLAEAISRSGGITANGDRSAVSLTRDNRTYALNLAALQDQGLSASRIPLLNGDVVNVRNRDESKVYVMGEIARPSALLMRNGRLSLNEALGEAGGPNLLTSNPGQIYVIRNNDAGNPQIYHLNAKNPTALALADRFPLRPRDVVYIDPVPLVMWNRIISLILPSAQIVYFGSEASK